MEPLIKYPVYDIKKVFESSLAKPEYLGTKNKGWFISNILDESKPQKRILFKEGRDGTGENWAEKVTSELAQLLYLPHADYHLAILEKGRQCVISPNFLLEDEQLNLGNQLIENYANKTHTLDEIFSVLKKNNVKIKQGKTSSVKTANEQFVGYLLFDAWIGNTDRHAENWGVITTKNRINYLAPTFDHASSLGRNESDKKRIDRINTKDKGYTVSSYVKKWVALIYDESKVPLNINTLVRKCKSNYPEATNYWIEEICKIMDEKGKVEMIFDRIPNDFISKPAIEFAMKILIENSKKLKELQI